MANGEWINFMNSGDFFFDNDVIKKFFYNKNDISSKSLIYGDVVKKFNTKQKYFTQSGINRRYLISGMICHQSMFMKRDVFINYGKFNLNYKIASDYDKILSIFFENHDNLHYIPYPIAYYDMCGFSENNYKDLIKERKIIALKHFSKNEIFFGNIVYFYRALKFYLKTKVEKC